MRNFILSIQNFIRRKLNITKEGPGPDLSSYHLIQTLSKNNTLKGYSWATTTRPFHPKNHDQYFSDKMVFIEGNILRIDTKYNPKSFITEGGESITIPYETGVVRSRDKFKYGYFECKIALPLENGQWPAFWLTGAIDWPPEIDIVEGYSYKDKYNNLCRIKSNLHYDKNKPKMVGDMSHPLPPSMLNDFIKYGVLWDENMIQIYYNGYLVREVKNPKYLKWFNQPMEIIINSAIQLDKEPNKYSTTYFKDVKIYEKISD